LFKREQTRIAKEIDSAQAEIAEAKSTDSPYREMLETALSYMRDAQRGYAQADPSVKRLWNRTLIERITIKGGELSGVEMKQPYHGLFLLASSNKRCLVGGPGFEPGASRSRNLRAFVCRGRFAGFEFISRAHGTISDQFQPPESPGLLHELLHEASRSDGTYRPLSR
jgi:hypothetical protein